MTKDIQHSFSQDKMHIVMRNTDCPNCEYHRKRTQLWREEAYRQAGHPLPEREETPAAWMVYTQEGQYAFVTDNPAVIHPSQRAFPLYTRSQV